MGTTSTGAVRTELTDLGRAVAGGLIFGVPLVFTMEVWWTGQRATPAQSLAVLTAVFGALVLLQRTSGFRSTRDVRLVDAVIDAVDVIGLSLVVVLALLVLLREVTLDTPSTVALGKVVHEAVAFSIGAGIASHYLRESRDDDGGGDEGGEDEGGDGRTINPTLADLGATAIGAVFVALNIAPTDEVPMLDSALDAPWIIGVVVASLVASYVIVFVAGFSGERQRRQQGGLFQHPITETVACYLVSLVAAGVMLRLFDRLDGSWSQSLSHAVVLALPASIGGAAGRLAV